MSSEQANGEAEYAIADCELSIAESRIYNLKSKIQKLPGDLLVFEIRDSETLDSGTGPE